MIVSINQPTYLPWLGYYDRIAASDLHIILDHVQFEKNSMTNRNKVRTSEGWTWLTVPVLSKGKFGDLEITKLGISENTKWQKKHWNTIKGSYSKAPFFKEHSGFFETVYGKEWHKLAPLMEEISRYLLDALSITTKMVRSSELASVKTKSDLILDLCIKVGATTYLSGFFGKDYLDIELFNAHGIHVQFQDYQHPSYQQIHGEFLSHMSVIDLLFNEGLKSHEILTGGAVQ